MGSNVTRVIGIDFGTSTSVVRAKRYKNGEPVGDSFSSSAVTFGNGQGDNKALTAVRRNGDGTYTCGREAEDMVPDAEVFREFKMELESPDEAKRAKARELTEEYFRYLYRWYDHQRSDMGESEDVEKTIVSFPVKWAEETREFMKDAAKKAGFPNVSSMDEPSAALYATLTRKMNDISAKGLLRSGENGYMLMVDMGAGTTDLAVCRYNIGDISGIIKAEQIETEIVATWPESADAPTFGGREVDRLLEDYLTDYLSSCGLDGAVARNLACSSGSVKRWKEETVSARLGEGRTVDTCGFLSGYMMLLPLKKPFPSIDRAKFGSLLGEKLEGFKSLVTGCLDHACEIEPDIAQSGLDFVILTGGHSSWYFTEELLNGTMQGITHTALKRVQEEKERVLRLSNPQETVALGLVYSLLPVKVEKQTKVSPEQAAVQEDLVKTFKAVAKKKSVFDEPITGPGQIQSSFDKPSTGSVSIDVPEANGGQVENKDARLDAARQFLAEWPFRNKLIGSKLPGWSMASAYASTLRWYNEAGSYQSVQVTVSETGIRVDSVNKPGKEEWSCSVSWDEFLSGQIRNIGFHVELRQTGQEYKFIVTIVNTSILKHLTEFFTELQRTLREDATSSFDKPSTGSVSVAGYANSARAENHEVNKTPMQPSKQGLVNISLTRKAQLSGAADKLMLQVNRGNCYEIGFGATIVIPLHPGRQIFTFWFRSMKSWKCDLEFDAHYDMALTAKAKVNGLLGNVITLYEGARIVASGKMKLTF